MEIDYKFEIRNYLDDNGRLKVYPSKHKYKIFALFYLAAKFERGKFYSESEINDMIDGIHTFGDRCLLRRELYNKRFFGRLNDCSKYWLENKQPVIEELINNY